MSIELNSPLVHKQHVTFESTIGTISGNQIILPSVGGTIALTSDVPSLSGVVSIERTITINGTTYDLSANREWNITSMIYPSAGIPLSTGTGWDASIVDNSANWNTAYGWGNHASAGYLTSITSTQVTNALGYTPYSNTNPSGYISGITGTMVTNALGYTPYNSTNPSGYITSSGSISGSSQSLLSPNGGSVIAANSAMPSAANSFYHTLALGPSNNDGHILGMTWTSAGIYGAQIWMDTDPTKRMALRGRDSAGNWTAWAEVLTDANISSYAASTSHQHDTLYYSGSARLWTGSDGTRNSGWAYHQDNGTGLHWPNNGWHIYPKDAADMYIRSGNSSESSIVLNTQGTNRGYVYANSSNEVGFLNNGRSWVFRMTSGGDAIMDYNYGASIVGVYTSVRYQGVWSMGNAYKLAIDGTNTGNLYGLAWSHPNAGGQAGYLSNHGLIHMMYGTAFATISDNIWCRNNITAYSDIRVKENIEVISNAMDKIRAIRGVTFTRNDMQDTSTRYAGVIAQEVEKVLPEVISTNKSNGHLSVAYGNMVGLTIEGLKEHDIIINRQQETISLLIDQIEYLKQVVNGITK